jgi:hypothetical protein
MPRAEPRSTPVWIAVAAVCLAGGGVARAELPSIRTLAAPATPIAVLAPLHGAVLNGGATVDLEWTESAAFRSLAATADEWEAFLSVDGGQSYPFRITPHLDRDLHRFRWQVPQMATTDARLLFRFGDERREVAYAPAIRFSIVATEAQDAAASLTETSFQRGEVPLPGHPGVVGWVSGTRRGGQLRQVAAPRPLELSRRPGLRACWSAPPTLAPVERRYLLHAESSAPRLSRPAEGELRTPVLRPFTAPISPLLQTQRLNE